MNRWNQVHAAWLNRPIQHCGPEADPGPFDFFNKTVIGDAENSRSDYQASEDDNEIARCVNKIPTALGYIGFSDYQANRSRRPALPIGTGPGAIPSSRNNDRALGQRSDVQRLRRRSTRGPHDRQRSAP